MTREQAIKRARRLKLEVRCGQHPTSPERRERAQAESRKRRAALEANQAQYDALLKEFNARPDVAALIAERKRLRTGLNQVGWEALEHRFEVGRTHNLGAFQTFHILGQGDTWEEAFANAEKTIQTDTRLAEGD